VEKLKDERKIMDKEGSMREGEQHSVRASCCFDFNPILKVQ